MTAPSIVPRKPKWLIILSNIRHNLTARWNFRRGKFDSDIGATHLHMSTEQSVAYINRVFEDYLAYGGIERSALDGRTVLELGPGDNLGVALRFYAAGATRVVCLDKLSARRDPTQQIAIYRALRAGLTDAERRRADRAMQIGNDVRFDPACIDLKIGIAAKEAPKVFPEQSFDFIVSRAVLAEIHDIDNTLRSLDHVLRPGGVMIHKFGYFDWMFRSNGYHPLEFLTIPDFLYDLMARDSGKSNRRTIAYYREAWRDLGYLARFHITRVLGHTGEALAPGVTSLALGKHYSEQCVSSIREIRPRMLPRFRELSDEDLLAEDMFVVAVKPA